MNLRFAPDQRLVISASVSKMPIKAGGKSIGSTVLTILHMLMSLESWIEFEFVLG